MACPISLQRPTGLRSQVWTPHPGIIGALARLYKHAHHLLPCRKAHLKIFWSINLERLPARGVAGLAAARASPSTPVAAAGAARADRVCPRGGLLSGELATGLLVHHKFALLL